MVVDCSSQRIARLTPLSAVLALIEARVSPVLPKNLALQGATGCTLAEDVVSAMRPAYPTALRDGFAVEAGALTDASSYAPVPFASMPLRLDAGDPLPDGADAVAPLDSVQVRAGRAAAIAPIAPGEGTLPAGGDIAPGTTLGRAGKQLRVIDVAVLAAAGIADVSVRLPRIRIVGNGASDTPSIDAARKMLFHAVRFAGGWLSDIREDQNSFKAALSDTAADAVVVLGGTGSGTKDNSVLTLAQLGRVEVHGFAVSPGETAAFGFVGGRPILLVPGRLDAALAIWLLLGRHLVAKLAGGRLTDVATVVPLKRKVASAIGLAELLPVSCVGGMADPLSSVYLSLATLSHSDGWIVVPADSEGFAAGTPVAVRPWP